ncbi:Protein VTS1 [Paramyrothecium foliicola]|nr:Protein VTS1 [Paramyrothecium foliicola]
MSGNHVIGNRNSTPEAASSLRPPSSRAVGSGSGLRASADMAALTGSSAAASRIRPSSDFYGQNNSEGDSQDKIAQQWIADIDQYETTLEEMAAATLDQDFKDELSAIEQWFRVLSEAERTAALYALLQQTTQVQIRFFIQVLQQMGKNHPLSGVLSPANFDKDPMSNRLSDAMNKLNVDSARNSFARNSTISTTKRHSGLDPSTINAMFPDAAAAIATEKAKFTQQTGNPPSSNRNSAAIDTRAPLGTPGLNPTQEAREPGAGQTARWGGAGGDQQASKPAGPQTPMGQFVQPPPSAGLRSPRPQLGSNQNIQSTTLNAPEKNPADLPLLSPYQANSSNWASMVNTPMTANFNTGNPAGTQADMVANATAMKLAALSTVNNRFALDDVRKYRRARSNDASAPAQNPLSPGLPPNMTLPGTNVVMINEHGQVLSRDQLLAIQAQQNMAALGGQRSRPSSPGIAMQSAMGPMSAAFASPQHNGFLSAYDGSSPGLTGGMGALNLGSLGVTGHEGYLSDHSDMVRGRSPRGRRGSSKPPEDPTDPTLLQDIPSWLRSLRLHKYTDNLKDMKWTDLVELDDKALEDRGVNALGARRKMLKVFEQVKDQKSNTFKILRILGKAVSLGNDAMTGNKPDMADPGYASDADSDLEELEIDIAKYDESVRDFLESHRGPGEQSRPVRGGPRGRGARGPRKAAKPRGDITARLSKVNQAFLTGRYADALDLAFEIIRINAETHQAWTTVGSIFEEQGVLDRALSAKVYAAHLRPKDVNGWLQCASFALETLEVNEAENLHTARLCFSAALRADPTNIQARLGKASVCHQQGHLSAAITEYNYVLRSRPRDLDLVRKLAEACVDNKHAESAVPSAIAAYQRFFDFARAEAPDQTSDALWHDVGIYVELFAATGRYREAIRELKALSRWLVGRISESYWDSCDIDDREWDADEERRLEVPEYPSLRSSTVLYGQSLPHDLRARLAIYRLRLDDLSEAYRHLSWLDPLEQPTADFSSDYPFLAYDIATELARCGEATPALRYFELLRTLPGDPDATIPLQMGRCYLVIGEQSAAEECFLAAIDADEDNIDARIELANMYEKAKEDEEALILAAEAMALRDAQNRGIDDGTSGPPGTRRASAGQPKNRAARPRAPRAPRVPGALSKDHVVPRRYRPKRLAGADRRRQDEQARALKLSQQYEVVRDLRRQINSGREDLVSAWMESSKELVDDFRSLKKFYTWDKYLHFLNKRSSLENPPVDQPQNELSLMYERLTRSLAPRVDQPGREGTSFVLESHQGISFDNWLDLFLDYAIGLAIAHRTEEAYQVCESAKDSNVFQSPKYEFVIYVAWSVCAIYANDEERCVATARYLMRDGATSDSYRMFALLSYLCQSPVSWYTSGPAQKFILRQIKALDASLGAASIAEGGDVDMDLAARQSQRNKSGLDVCLLMLYGHILFTSTSYTYALCYFLRARALDNDNTMVNLSLGLAYIHHGLKRQSANRQYLLLQGQAFLSHYVEVSRQQPHAPMAVVYYNMGRLFQLLGINYMAVKYYSDAMKESQEDDSEEDIKRIISINNLIGLLNVKNKHGAYKLLKTSIIL